MLKLLQAPRFARAKRRLPEQAQLAMEELNAEGGLVKSAVSEG